MTYHSPQHLSGMRTFVVEQDPLVALDVALSLQDAGAEVFGPYPNSETALDALTLVHQTVGIDVAVLDMELGAETTAPVARALQNLGIPIIFHTGNPAQAARAYGGIDATVVQKPSSTGRLIEGVMQLAAAPQSQHRLRA